MPESASWAIVGTPPVMWTWEPPSNAYQPLSACMQSGNVFLHFIVSYNFISDPNNWRLPKGAICYHLAMQTTATPVTCLITVLEYLLLPNHISVSKILLDHGITSTYTNPFSSHHF
jgi:hypothetical protein